MHRFLMKEKNRFLNKVFGKSGKQGTEILLEVISFHDKDMHYAFTPSLNLMGYGKTEHDATESWKVVVENYLNYTRNKGTLVQDLKSYGWTVATKKLTPPNFSWLLQHNDQVVDIYNNHNFQKSSRPVKMPIAEVCA